MKVLRTVEAAHRAEYVAFWNNEGAFNLVSSLDTSENGFNLSFGETGYFRLSIEGFLAELELMFVHPIRVKELPLPVTHNQMRGLPVLDVHSRSILSDPVVVMDESATVALVLFSGISSLRVGQILVSGGLKYYLAGMDVQALEIGKLVEDPDGSEQMTWLSQRGLL